MTQEYESGHLALLLGMARQPRVRQLLKDLSLASPPMAPPAAQALLFECAELVIRDAATLFATALNADFSHYVSFFGPKETAVEFRTPVGVLRRLDRAWGGPAMVQLDVMRTWKVTWPGPSVGRLLVLRGKAAVDGIGVSCNELFRVEAGATVEAAPGTLMLWRRSILSTVLDAAVVAGLDAAEIVHAVAGNSRLRINPAAGMVRVLDRAVRLTARETAAMDLLNRSAGKPVARRELARALALANDRRLDRIMLGLRNKLGDGWITTVYGVGYALEN